ncbi:hypothetical protein MJO28_012452 [Puccinia striiformis f. sp. tritici]|uniref:Uncharacterized protein n=1 Tax=Puccinia striiformis f. sp. tritici TaxID=168172 RepID=A0ACC0E238_9BASI|nr:hypothetical protein MJO28_012452 [Puccinia striiformis f. sp. tritici]
MANRPFKPSKSQLKQQARILENQIFKPSKPIKLSSFIKEIKEIQGRKQPEGTATESLEQYQHLKRAATLNDLIGPLEPIYKDSNLLSELRDHHHELATPHGSLHALHLSSEQNEQNEQPNNSKRVRLTQPEDIPVEITTHNIPDYLDPSLFDSFSPSTTDPTTTSTSLTMVKYKPPTNKRVRKKAAGPPQSINHKPKPIQDLINRLSSTGLQMLQSHFDAMLYVRSIGRSDWNTSTQPMHSNLSIPIRSSSSSNEEPILLTVTFHPFSKTNNHNHNTTNSQESLLNTDSKSVSPRKQTIHILSNQRLSDLRDVVSCSANQIPICSNTQNHDSRDEEEEEEGEDLHWSDHRWVSGSAFVIENVLFSDTSSSDSGNDSENLSQKSDYAVAIHPTDPPLTSIPTANLSTPAPTTTTTENKAPRQEESQSRQTVYPITSFLSRINSPKCRVCDRDPARLIIINDELCAESPCFICFTCFKFLHSHEDIFLDHHLHQSSTTTVVDEISNSDSAPTLGNSSGRKIRWGKVKGREWWVVPLLGST